MPGHKGVERLGMEASDITEIEGADVLYHADGIIRQSEAYAAELFGTGRTLYSTEGSSLCIRAMLHLALLHARAKGDKDPVIVAGRNAHKTFLSAAALLDFSIEWLFPQGDASLLSCPLDVTELDKVLSAMPKKPAAVYVTSPDYLGNTVDIAKLAPVCHKYGTLLLVDNAHGAYLRFLPRDRHPITLGADMCCDSAHKTLPVLTGGAYLHLSRSAPRILSDMAEAAMSLFASTSPSYLILQSLDAANRYLSEGYTDHLAALVVQLETLKAKLTQYGYLLVGDEPLKLTLAPKSFGYTGRELADALLKRDIVCEFSDPDFLVMMITPEIDADALSRLKTVLMDIPRRVPILTMPPRLERPERVLSPRQALLSPACPIRASEALGRVLSDPGVHCPPAVPILVCGERIDKSAIRHFAYYGIDVCHVVADENP